MVTVEIKKVKLSSIKQCTKCKVAKSKSEFSPLKASSDGLHSWCRKCKNAADKERRAKNPGKKRESDKVYREKNLERIREYDRNRERDPAERKLVYAKWLMGHADRSREIKRKWEKNHPDKVMDLSRVKRARRRNAIIEKFSAVEIYERDHWKCQLCRKPVNKKLKWPDPMSPSIDHIIPLSKGGAHERRNVQLAHVGCNMKAGVGGVKQMRLM